MKRKIFAAFIMLVSFGAIAFANTHPVVLVTEKAATSKYTDVVTILADPSKNSTVTVISNSADTLRFYIFDTEGTLVHQDELVNKQTKTIDKLKKGTYTFDVFLKNKGVQHSTLVIE